MMLLRVESGLAFGTGDGTARRGRPSKGTTVRVRRVREERRRKEVRGERRALHSVLLQVESKVASQPRSTVSKKKLIEYAHLRRPVERRPHLRPALAHPPSGLASSTPEEGTRRRASTPLRPSPSPVWYFRRGALPPGSPLAVSACRSPSSRYSLDDRHFRDQEEASIFPLLLRLATGGATKNGSTRHSRVGRYRARRRQKKNRPVKRKKPGSRAAAASARNRRL